jgi:RNA polymerase sigma factor (sigma-70 family)
MTDGQLLQQFARDHAAAAFEELVRRHGPMVLRVCQRLLRAGPDAEDAFQATFIVLVRKASSIAKLESVGSWLYGVAYRIALRAKVRAQRKQERERRYDEALAGGNSSPAAASDGSELRPLLHEELSRLPEKYRAPVVLCYLEGKTNEEAARQLQWPAGTVKIRLSRARKLLHGRLVRRGMALSAGALALALSNEAATAAVPSSLMASTAQAAAGGTATAGAGALADAAVKGMTAFKLKVAASVVAVASVVAAGVTLIATPKTDSPPLQLRTTFEGHSDGVFAMAWFPDGRSLATGGGERIIRLWDAGSGKEWGTLTGHRHKILSLAVSPDGTLLASGEGDLHGPAGEVKLWHIAGRHEVAALPPHEDGASSLGFTPDGQVLATASWGGTIRLWDVVSHRLLNVLGTHRSGVSRITISPDGTLLASASNDRMVGLWDMAAKKQRAMLQAHQDVVTAVAFSPDSATVASGSNDRTIRLWDVQTHEQRLIIQAGSPVQCLSFAPRGEVLLSGQTEKIEGADVAVLKLWDIRTGQPIASISAHKQNVGAALFSPDGHMLATCSWDRTAKLWDVHRRAPAWTPAR